MKNRPVLYLVNSPDQPAQANILGLANTLELDEEGWAIIPYGDSRHSGRDARAEAQLTNAADRELVEKARNGVIQRFTRGRAEQMVRDFKSLAGRFKRAIVGTNIYKGHPDAQAYAHIFRDKIPRGAIADMEAGEHGLRLKPVLTDQGAADVEGGWNQHSPNWLTEYVGDDPVTGLPVVEPFLFKSLGLVPKGNIPGLSLVNAGGELVPAADPTNPPMNKYLLELLKLMGIKIAADADDTAQASAVESAKGLFAAANAAVTELTTVKEAKAGLETQLNALKGEKLQLANSAAALTTEREGLKTQLAAERKERSLLLVNAAIVEGRLPAAERDARVLVLCNAADFTVAATDLAQLNKQLKTTSGLGELSQQGRNVQDRQAKVLSLVNAALASPEIQALPLEQRYDTAFTKVQKDPANAGLFAAMKKPGAA